eukprot:3466623-Rhodomonas_salina.6
MEHWRQGKSKIEVCWLPMAVKRGIRLLSLSRSRSFPLAMRVLDWMRDGGGAGTWACGRPRVKATALRIFGFIDSSHSYSATTPPLSPSAPHRSPHANVDGAWHVT